MEKRVGPGGETKTFTLKDLEGLKRNQALAARLELQNGQMPAFMAADYLQDADYWTELEAIVARPWNTTSEVEAENGKDSELPHSYEEFLKHNNFS